MQIFGAFFFAMFAGPFQVVPELLFAFCLLFFIAQSLLQCPKILG